MGSIPTSRAIFHILASKEFAVWLMQVKGNRDKTIVRKLKYFKKLSGTPQDMVSQVLMGNWNLSVR